MIEYKSVSLANQVFEKIEYNILSGNYKIGERISEKRLASELGVSRTILQIKFSKTILKNPPLINNHNAVDRKSVV